MNYQKHYDALIERARHRKIEGYSEKHHILPKCLGGSDDPSNLVSLTAAEHYIAHQLLVKLHPGDRKILHAALVMSSNPHGKRFNNKRYGWLKSKLSSTVKGVNHHNYGKKLTAEQKCKISNSLKGRVFSEETRRKMSEAAKGSRNSQYGKKASEETRIKLSAALRRRAINNRVNKQLLKGAE